MNSGGPASTPGCTIAAIIRALVAFIAFAAMDPARAATPPVPLTTLRQVRELPPATADLGLSVEIEGVMTLVDRPRHMTFVHDGTASVYLQVEGDHALQTGHRIRASCTTRAGRFTPFLRTTNVTVLGSDRPPDGRALDFETFRAGFYEGERVTLRGRVLAVVQAEDRWRLRLGSAGQIVNAWFPMHGAPSLEALRHAQVQLTGICAGVFNDQNEIVDFHLHAALPGDVTVDDRAGSAQLPAVAQGLITLQSGVAHAEPERVICRGRVTLFWPGRHLFLQDASGSLEVRTDENHAFQAGDEIEATGYRTVAHRRMILAEASLLRLDSGPPAEPIRVSLPEIHSRHSHGGYVEVEAMVTREDFASAPGLAAERLTQTAQATGATLLVLRQGDATVRVEFENPEARARAPEVPIGSTIRLRGVLAAQPAVAGEPLTYRLLVPDPADIRLIARAPWWSAERALAALGGTFIAVLSGAGWAVGLSQRRRRKAEQAVRRQREKAMRHRDALLNLTRLVQNPASPGLIQQITELVSSTLGGPRVSVWRLENDGLTLACQDLFANGCHADGQCLSATEFPHYFAALSAEPIIAVEQGATDPRTREFAEAYLQPNDIHSLLDVPLRFHGQPAGVLCIEQTRQPRSWDVEEQSFAAGVADQLTILREATERLRAERALREAHGELEIRVMLRTTELAEARDRAEAADRLKSAFLATMSHELRTPLNSIIGFTGILLQGMVGPLAPEQRKQLGMVQNSARHLLSLINDVLDISKIEAGQVEVVVAEFALHDMLHHVIDLVRPLADRKSIRLDLEASAAPPRWASDRRRVEQILINLLNNAIKFTDRGTVQLVCTTHEQGLAFHVVDSGIGIREEHVPQLFKPFRQLDTGLARQHEGTGLGLAICAGLAKLLRGSIQVTSTFGQGSRFTVVLPHQDPGKS